jgi:hypothetical protein
MGIFSRRDKDGYDKKGYDKDGYDKDGYDKKGYDKDGYDQFGYNEEGYDRVGYNKLNFDKNGNHRRIEDMECGRTDDDEFDTTHNFLKIISTYNSSFDVVLEIAYDEPTKIKSKLFFSHDDKMGIYSKEFESFSNKNKLHFHIEKAGKGYNTTWNYEGDGEIGDNFESGYTLMITMQLADSELRYFLIDKLKELSFGCIPSSNTLHCHKDERYPTGTGAKELLQNVLELFNSANDVES